jgi:hypothetical protein
MSSPAFMFAKAIARKGSSVAGTPYGVLVKNTAQKERARKRDDSFRGKLRCNQDWMSLESVEARRLRGHGIFEFTTTIRQERNNKCRCGKSKGLRLYHVLPATTHRQLRFERSNVLLLCPNCCKGHRWIEVIIRDSVRRQTSSSEAAGSG